MHRSDLPITPISVLQLFRRPPDAVAHISGIDEYPKIKGFVNFYQILQGVLVLAEINGLPQSAGQCGNRVFGFHIHQGASCSGNAEDPLADTQSHYNPHRCPHPYHAGDLPPLFGNRGSAYMLFLTDRFSVREIVGKTVVIHSKQDDFTSQPAGTSGQKIACGRIVRS